ncbi:uncharacterized protein ACLA_093920 [Aspergillus clavatus NRRL 1]|uniref:Hsp70 family chaperone n=1 Tax=Aspergillus clavatus (strain ATCC 1007 / CBS 513.65 / DSM 816 / NCTC 3887 / NRRL 1 / QM 1276 / 107) TaxID=344612 RepID=A1CFP4_ASPCL|nr:uncharacterized protein ACLA_093920 [Aspergillus clavatus NRRL 1]EAW11693.1 hypothetical protein ACLA_093920 [Aspergillus clavatus NRRL 1]
MSCRQRIVVGIDFGTSNSGFSVAWALQTSPDDVEVLSAWPGGGNSTSTSGNIFHHQLIRSETTPRVPTTISYENNQILWGHQTSMFGEVIRGIKLLLDPTQEIKHTPVAESKKILEKYNKDPADVARDHLQLLIAKTKEVLKCRFGDAIETMEIQYVMTVPAVWTDKAKNNTLTAATEAGIPVTDLTLVSEPEAAALYCLKSIQPNTIKNGDAVLICDAGGGTVDLISYCVKSIHPLRLEEATAGTGNICGSVLLDKRFEDHLIGILGERKYRNLSQKSREFAMKYWQENIKPHFAGLSDEDDSGYSGVDYFVPLAGVGDKRMIGLESGLLTLSQQTTGGIFNPVVDEIEALIQEQMVEVSSTGKQIKAILLVGGFGSSECLLKRLRSAIINVTVMQPPNALLNVSRGAVLRGLEGNQVNKRIGRRHYGVSFSQKYDPKIHHRTDKYWNSFYKEWSVDNRMSWCIKRSESLLMKKDFVNHPIPLKAAEQDLRCVEDSLYICNMDDAPDSKTADVFKFCTLKTYLSAIPRSFFKLRTDSRGKKYYRIDYQIVMTPTSASLLFHFEFNGVSYGSVQAKY